MAIVDDFRDLTSRIESELARGSDYYDHARTAWRLLERVVAEGGDVGIVQIATGNKTDGPAIASLARGYVAGYLAESVFTHYVSLFEDYTFGLIGFWLMSYPKGITGLDADESDTKFNKTDKTIPLSFITDNTDRESILRAVVDRELDRLKYRKLAAWFAYLEKNARLGSPSPDQIESLAEIKAARDVIVHNRGIVNPTYLFKASAKARYAEGARLEITEPYLRASWQLINSVVRETSTAALTKWERSAASDVAALMSE